MCTPGFLPTKVSLLAAAKPLVPWTQTANTHNTPPQSDVHHPSKALCHTPSWLDLGEPSHTCIHLTMDHDLTQLNALSCMGNMEYSPTQTSLTSTDISRQAGMAH